MEIIADILVIAGTIAVSIYCMVLARRLSRFTDLEKGVGGAIAVLSVQVDDMTKTLVAAQKSAVASANKLEALNKRAESTSQRLELLIASLHDLPEVTAKESSIETEDPQPMPIQPETDQPESEVFFLSQRSRVEAAE